METDFLVAFDLDGTMIRDEWAHGAAYRYLAERYNINIERFQTTTGLSLRRRWVEVLSELNRSADVEEIAREHFEYTLRQIQQQGQQSVEGLELTLKRLQRMGCKLAVTSSSDDWFVHAVLDYLHLETYFELCITQKDVKQLKPEPDIYLEVLRRSGISASAAVGVEDSCPGCRAVKRAGMTCLGFSDFGNNPQNIEDADYKIDSMSQIPEIVEQLRKA